MNRAVKYTSFFTLFLLIGLLQVAAQGVENPVAQVEQGSQQIVWTPSDGYWQVTLRILDSVGAIAERSYEEGEKIAFDLAGLPDGAYRWELIAQPAFPSAVSDSLANAAAQGQLREYSEDAKRRGDIPKHPVTQSGAFTIAGGVGVLPDLLEDGSNFKFRQVLNENQIIRGRLCVGFNCPTNPEFGLTNILVMDNTLRLKFDDTSSTGTFPDNDWELTVNDAGSTGAEKFALKDCGASSGGGCEGNEVFTVVAGAPNGALFVDAAGKVGLKTTSPVAELHILDGDSPSIRLDQQGGPLAAQSWDLGGDNANFFVRDVTGGNQLPFKIAARAATDTLVLSAANNVGIGTAAPETKLHIRGDDADPFDTTNIRLRVQNVTAVEENRTLLELVNNGGVAIFFEDTSSGLRWQIRARDNEFAISRLNTAISEFTLTDTGNLVITGTLTQMSDRDSKSDIVPVDVEQVLARVADLPISTWSNKKDAKGVRHMGPMAQDFYAAFGLGDDERRIATLDTSGAALAAIQALHRQVEELRTHDTAGSEAANEPSPAIEALADAVERLTQRVAELETALAQAQGNQ